MFWPIEAIIRFCPIEL